MRPSVLTLLFIPLVSARAPSGPWDAFNYAPKSKTVYPIGIYRTQGQITGSTNLVGNVGQATIAANSWVALDFGIEVGGLISLNFGSSNVSSTLALSFSESPSFVRPDFSDDSSYPAANTTYDGVLTVRAPLPSGYWTQPANALRGGFRYLTLVAGPGAVTISNVSCAISFMPHWDDLRAYTGYFYAKDKGFHDEDFLTKIWYAGAYTVQTNTVPLNTGRQVPFAKAGTWFNNATLGVAGPIIVDGAKRDRAVWPGDMGIAVPAQFVSTHDLIPTRNALATMFAHINPRTGALPESGPPLSQLDSDTYHAWTLIGTHNYYFYTADNAWVNTIWTNYTRAVAFLEQKVDYANTGLMNVTGLRDWARLGGGGFNSEGNALLYKVLTTASELANFTSRPDLSAAYARNASRLKTRFDSSFWVNSVGMYRDNLTTTLSPQDANSLAVLYNLTTRDEQKTRVSAGLTKNWNELGAIPPELPDTISPFISGFELQAHFEAGEDARALDLLHREWGYMLYTNLSVQSTLLEGFTANGSLAYRWFRGYNNDPAYTSHAHGWSAGPTAALTTYVLGLSVTSPRGMTWSVAPHISGLDAVEGGFETGEGWFGVKWATANATARRVGSQIFTVDIETPPHTSGIVKIPVLGLGVHFDAVSRRYSGAELRLDGRKVDTVNIETVKGIPALEVKGGKHTIAVVKLDH